MNRNLWQKLSNFFENGDLTPFAVVISIAHYGPVLARHGENLIVAWLVGTLIDLLHFRTVRRLFQAKNDVWLNRFVAVLTTLMALGYHLRFYGNDFLLAAPIPLGIAILAQHAAARGKQDIASKWRNRVRFVIGVAKRDRKRASDFETSYNRLQNQISKAQTDYKELQERYNRLQETNKDLQAIVKAWQSLNGEAQALARFNAKLITAEQAKELIGVADVRTVQARAEKLNGVHK